MPSHRFPAPAPRRGKNADSSRESATPETSGRSDTPKKQDFSRSAERKTPRRDGRNSGEDARKPARRETGPNNGPYNSKDGGRNDGRNGGRGNTDRSFKCDDADRKPGRGNAGRKPRGFAEDAPTRSRREDEFATADAGTDTGFKSAFARSSRPEPVQEAPREAFPARESTREQGGEAHQDAPQEEGFLQPGIKPVTELLQKTPEKIDTVYLLKGRKGKETGLILDLCREHGVRFSLMDETGLARLWRGRHQGVIARLFATGFTEFKDLLALTPDAPLPLIVALDQVQDPGNAGALARTLYALGGSGLLVPRHNGVFLGAAAARVAAGALDKLPVAKAANLAQALDEALDAGYAVYGAEAVSAQDGASTGGIPAHNVYEFDPDLPAVLVLGSEEGGLRPIIRKRCTAFLSIPFAREFDSLNVAQAGAIIISAFAAARRSSK